MQVVRFIHGAISRRDCLGQYLATEHMLCVVVLTAVQIHLDPLDVQNVDDFLQPVVHVLVVPNGWWHSTEHSQLLGR